MAFAESFNRPIPGAVATAGVDERATFIKKTYAHLGGAIALFVLFEYLFLQTEIAQSWTRWALSGWNWLLVLGMFMVAGWVGEKWAQSDTSRGVQYLGLAVYIAAETIIFAPILYLIAYVADSPHVIGNAAIITLIVFAGLTATVLLTRKDFSFLRGALSVGAMVAMGVIVASILFGFALGTIFAALMVALAAGYILYYTSRVLAYYRPTQYVAAALALFSAVGLLFWYILQLVWSLSGE
ncbi:MAG: Bax inhibitor-1 family protein [Proteobacteria bacterium]|nr:Bax inhibitor-1 family protein [Pseudomonadota bacterium]